MKAPEFSRHSPDSPHLQVWPVNHLLVMMIFVGVDSAEV